MPPKILKMIAIFLTVVTLLVINVASQRTDMNTETCTYSFVVPRPDIVSTCKTYSSQQVEQLTRTITALQQKVDVLSGGGSILNRSSSLLPTANPTFSCNCDNTTTFSFAYRDCQDVRGTAGYAINGVYEIEPVKSTGQLLSVSGGSISGNKYWVTTTWGPMKVLCQLEEDDIGWTVIMRRKKMDTSFDRSFQEYKDGFGNMSGDFWLGLENIYRITNQRFAHYLLWIVMKDKRGIPVIYPYGKFAIADEDSGYMLEVDDFHGSGITDYFHSGKVFVTRDSKPETTTPHSSGSYTYHNCAAYNGEKGQGGWWFSGTGRKSSWYDSKPECGNINLNAKTPYWSGIANVTFVEMKIRPSL